MGGAQNKILSPVDLGQYAFELFILCSRHPCGRGPRHPTKLLKDVIQPLKEIFPVVLHLDSAKVLPDRALHLREISASISKRDDYFFL